MENAEILANAATFIFIVGLLLILLTMGNCYTIFLERVKARYTDIGKLPIDTMYNQWVGNTYWFQPPIPIMAKFAEPEITAAAQDFNRWVKYIKAWLLGGMGVIFILLGISWVIKKYFL